MRGLSRSATCYIFFILTLAGAVLVWSVPAIPRGLDQWVALAVLTILAATAQMFPVVLAKNQAYYLNVVFIFAAVLLLPPGGVAVVICIASLPEWIKVKFPWYIHLFNVANLLLDTHLARACFGWFTSSTRVLLDQPSTLAGAVFSALAFTFLNHALLAVVLKLARRHSWRETGLFNIENFLTDATLAGVGIITAVLWAGNPWWVLLTSAPLFLIYRGLNTSNLVEQARADPKTGLYNAKHFFQVLQEEVRRAQRFERPLSVIMADMDLLRNVNNTYGHLAGDVVLKEVAEIIRISVRDHDIAARFGGEEFVVLLPETDTDEAFGTAERLRKRVAEARFKVTTSAEPIRVTLSLGVASFPVHGGVAEEVIHQADLAVYYAKVLGRNRTWASSPESMALVGGPDCSPELASRFDFAVSPYLEDPDRPGSGLGSKEGEAMGNVQSKWATGRNHPDQFPKTGSGKPLDATPAKKEKGADFVPPKARDRANERNWLLISTIAVIAFAALLIWLARRPWEADLDWGTLALMGLMTLVAQYEVIAIYGRGNVSTGGIVVLASGFLFGLDGALLLSVLIPAVQWIRSRGPAYRSVFDLGNATCWVAVSVVIYEAAADVLPRSDPYLLLIAALLASVAYYAVNIGFLCMVMGISEHRRAGEIWMERFRWLFVYYLVYGAVALAIALSYRSVGIYGLLAFFTPLLLIRYVMKQYIDRTEENVAALHRVNDELRDTYNTTIAALSTALDSRDSETEGHSQRVVDYTQLIAKAMGLSEQQIPGLLNGALLHDVGKIGVPDAILRKPGPLTPEEWTVMKQHPEQGYQMLRHIDFLHDALPVVRYHHERFDGEGYPEGLQGEDIPISARIFAVADTFDAITSDRPYRRARSCDAARKEIARCSGIQYDPRIVEAFLHVNVRELSRLSGQSIDSRESSAEPLHLGMRSKTGAPASSLLHRPQIH